MTKRSRLTVEEVLDNVLSDDEDYDDPDEPMMPGSDDEFSDLEIDSDEDYDPGSTDTSSNIPDSPIRYHCSHSPSPPDSPRSPGSPPSPSGTYNRIISPFDS